MTTHEIANRLVELCRKADYETCYRELYSPNASSNEPEHWNGPQKVQGIQAILEKGKIFQSQVEQVFDSSVSDPIVAGN